MGNEIGAAMNNTLPIFSFLICANSKRVFVTVGSLEATANGRGCVTLWDRVGLNTRSSDMAKMGAAWKTGAAGVTLG